MKRFLTAPVVAGLTAVTLAACGTGSTGSSGNEAPLAEASVNSEGVLAGKKILYVDAVPGNALLDGLAQGLAAELNAEGAEMARVFQLNAQNQVDLSVANQRINEGIAEGVDAIVTFPLDANAIRPGVKAANEAGIPIFTFQDLGDLDVTGALRFPDEARGKESGLALAELAGIASDATVLSGNPTPNIEAAVKGAIEGLEEGGMTLVGDPNNQRNLQDDAPGAQKVAQAIFQKYPDLKVLLVYNSASATGAIAAARQAGMSEQVLIGTMAGEDTNIEQIKQGQLALSYDFNGLEYGTRMAELVATGLENEGVKNEVADAPLGEVYTEENVDSFVPWAERQEYIKIPSTF